MARAAMMEVAWILLIVTACLTALLLCCACCAVKRFAPENTRGPVWEVNSKGERWVPAENRKPRDSRGWIWAEINPEAPPRLPIPPKRPGSPLRPEEAGKAARSETKIAQGGVRRAGRRAMSPCVVYKHAGL